ncbi:MAG: DUF308 domain-containing protein, partial [Bacteroidales bacterium]|nr:DUF308 domain-containing protein [Bacteroidales bacterium]
MKKSNWVIFFVNGIIAIVFGLLALLVPHETILTTTIYFGLFILLAGLITLYVSYKNSRAKKPYLLLMAEGILAVVVGGVIAFYPKSSLFIFLIMVGVWAVIMGLFQIVIAVQMRKKVSRHSLFTINGIITLVFGILLFFNPFGAVKALMAVIGLIALAAG